jgi:hypothetical protein
MRLEQADFEKHGYTIGCPACTVLRRGDARPTKEKPRHKHTESCRTRIETELLKTPEGKSRKAREESRREEELDRRIAQEDARVQAQEEQTQEQEQAQQKQQQQGQTQGQEQTPAEVPSRDRPEDAPVPPQYDIGTPPVEAKIESYFVSWRRHGSGRRAGDTGGACRFAEDRDRHPSA